ncbi:MAG TPA: multicopper oxidase family protein [Acidimicrobiales bacterium]|nr:multicopper oxidase family protein [Acidimicrobiales bacterium]
MALVIAALAPSVFAGSPVPAASAVPAVPFSVALPIPQTLTDADITLVAQQAEVPIRPGAPTTMWTYNGTFPGPTIRRPSGQPTRVTVVNQLPASTGELTLHHHGAHASSADDGQPMDLLIPTGGSRRYDYEMTEAGEPERGALQWYHDHRMDVTGRNVWMGLAGMFIVDDPAEAVIDAQLPNGAYDVPLMVVDRSFNGDNQIPYTFTSEGVNGDTPLVNGAPQPYFEVAARRYRLRLLNASNNRSYNVALSNGAGLVQVGSESGLLPAPVVRSSLLLGPAERADVVVDFTGLLGQDVVLRNTAGSGAIGQLMQFRVRRDEADPSSIPATLRAPRVHQAGPLESTRTWVLGRDVQSGMWTINGRGFEHDRVDATPVLGQAERWTFINSTSVDHLVHIHDVDWKVVSRTGGLPALTDVAESGAKESFRIRPQEVVVVESTFTDHTGRFVWHCHMLEHEDFSMMTQFEVVPGGGAPAGPVHDGHEHSH